MKATAIAPSNIAFIKYWGKSNQELNIPVNGSISMNLSAMSTTTTVQFCPDLPTDQVCINGERDDRQGNRVSKHLDLVRAHAGISTKARVVSITNFPIGTGLSSSAAGFAALSMAAANAAGLVLTEQELSILARQGSGSACRSIPDGFVLWHSGQSHETSYAQSIFSPDHWDLVDIVAVVSTEKKEVPTTEGQKSFATSPFFAGRLQRVPDKLHLISQLLRNKDFTLFGQLVEAEALELHAIMLTSQPSLMYWTPNSLHVMKLVKQWRAQGLEVYFTCNTGQDIHLLCQPDTVDALKDRLRTVESVSMIIENRPACGARIIDDHLF